MRDDRKFSIDEDIDLKSDTHIVADHSVQGSKFSCQLNYFLTKREFLQLFIVVRQTDEFCNPRERLFQKWTFFHSEYS